MKIETSIAAFRSVLDWCTRVTERRNTQPILGHALLIARKGGISLRASNLDVEIQLDVRGKTSGAGEVAIPVFALAKLFKSIDDEGAVSISAGKGNRIAISFEGSTFEVTGFPAGDFPPPLKTKGAEGVELDAAVLRAALGTVSPAISTEETRYYLNGVCLDFHDKVPLAVATDGHRLITTPAGVSGKLKEKSFIIHSPVVKLLRELPVTALRIGGMMIEAAFDGGTLRGKLIDGTFPDWRRVVPDVDLNAGGFEPQAMTARLRRMVAAASEGNSTKVAFAFSPSGDAVLSLAGEVSGHELFSFEPHGLKDVRSFAVNARYLIDLLRVVGGFEMAIPDNESAPVRMVSGDVTLVLMPMLSQGVCTAAEALLPRARKAA